jgi:hypothetical protein
VIDIPLTLYLTLLALMLALAVAADFRRRAREGRDRRERDLREAMGATLGRDPPIERSAP